MVNEADTKRIVNERMRVLTNETRKLCGLPPVLDHLHSISKERGGTLSFFYPGPRPLRLLGTFKNIHYLNRKWMGI